MPSRETTEVPVRRTIPASEVGVTLAISRKALKKLDQIQEEAIKAAQEVQKILLAMSLTSAFHQRHDVHLSGRK